MVKKEIIKQHNKNFKEINDLIEAYEIGGVYLGNPWEVEKYSINKVSKIFRAKKTIVNAYNEFFVEKYNELIEVLNEQFYEHNKNKQKEVAFEKRYKDLKKIQSKLLEMCEKVYKPENFDYCMHIKHRLYEIKPKLDATISETHWSSKQVPVEKTHYDTYSTVVGGVTSSYDVPSTTTIYETVNEKVTTSYPDYETRDKARKELDYLHQEIEKQQNYDYNLKLCDLYNSYDDLTEYLEGNHWSYIMDGISRKIKENKNIIETATKLLEKFENILDSEKTLIGKLGNFELRDLKAIKNSFKPSKIDERFVCYEMDGFGETNYSLYEWSKECNSQIDTFNVDFVEKCDTSKLEKDYVHYYDDYYDYPEY